MSATIDTDKEQKEAIQLLEQDKKGKFKLRADKLEALLKDVNVKDRQLVVVSVVGAFRRGKSFLLNFMLRYLRAQSKEDWIEGDGSLSLEGFSWRGGKDRDTTGILVWPEVFLVGDNKAVMLMDTQGTFDSKTTFKDNAIIFALSTLVSSVQVFNLSERIQMDDLSNLQYFCEFGRMVQEQCKSKAFQKLIFLIRDWKFPKENSYGFFGGGDVLDDWLGDESVNKDQVTMIKTCFSELKCFLMPHPGDKVSCDVNFKGTLEDIDEKFLEQMREFVDGVLGVRRLVTKEVGGRTIRARDLVHYMSGWLEALQSDAFEPKTLFESMAEISHQNTARAALDKYETTMSAICGGATSVPELPRMHEEAKKAALQQFDEADKFGGNERAKPTRDQLMKDIDARYETLSSQNSAKLKQEETMAREERLREAGEAALASYHAAVEVCQGVKAVPDLPALHERAKETALAKFAEIAKAYEETYTKPYLDKLNKEISNIIKKLEVINAEKLEVERQEAVNEELRETFEERKKMYCQFMEEQCGGSKASKNIDKLHKAAKDQAISSFKEVASKHDKKKASVFLKKLERELQDNFFFYKLNNDEKLTNAEKDQIKGSLQMAKDDAFRTYESTMASQVSDTDPTSNLEAIHLSASQAAFEVFNATADKFKTSGKTQANALKRDIEAQLPIYRKKNTQLVEKKKAKQVQAILHDARDDAVSELKDELEAASGKPLEGLSKITLAAHKKAMAIFEKVAKEHRMQDQIKTLRTSLKQQLQEMCTEWQNDQKELYCQRIKEMVSKIQAEAAQELQSYKSSMSAKCRGSKPVTDLAVQQDIAKGQAMSNFNLRTSQYEAAQAERDNSGRTLVKGIDDFYTTLEAKNIEKEINEKLENDRQTVNNEACKALNSFSTKVSNLVEKQSKKKVFVATVDILKTEALQSFKQSVSSMEENILNQRCNTLNKEIDDIIQGQLTVHDTRYGQWYKVWN